MTTHSITFRLLMFLTLFPFMIYSDHHEKSNAYTFIPLRIDGIHSIEYNPDPFNNSGTSTKNPVYYFSISEFEQDIESARSLDCSTKVKLSAIIGSESGEPLYSRLDGTSSRNREHLTQELLAFAIPKFGSTIGFGMRHNGTYTDRFENYNNNHAMLYGIPMANSDLGDNGLTNYTFINSSHKFTKLISNSTVARYDHWDITPHFYSPIFKSGRLIKHETISSISPNSKISVSGVFDKSSWYPYHDKPEQHQNYRAALQYNLEFNSALSLQTKIHKDNFTHATTIGELTVISDSIKNSLRWRINGGMGTNSEPFGSFHVTNFFNKHLKLDISTESLFFLQQSNSSFLVDSDTIHYISKSFRNNKFNAKTTVNYSYNDIITVSPSAWISTGSSATRYSLKSSTDSIFLFLSQSDDPLTTIGVNLDSKIEYGDIVVKSNFFYQNAISSTFDSLWVPWHITLSAQWGKKRFYHGDIGISCNFLGPITITYLKNDSLISNTSGTNRSISFWAYVPFYSPIFQNRIKPSVYINAGPFSIPKLRKRPLYHPFGSQTGPSISLKLTSLIL